jgi:hypothetical protein
VNLLLPNAAPAEWFPDYATPPRYAALTDELRPMAAHVWNHTAWGTDGEAAAALDQISRHPAMAWMAAHAYAATVCAWAPLLPPKRYMVLDLPPRLAIYLPRRERDAMDTAAAGFLTAAARGHLAAPIPGHGPDAVSALISALLRAAVIAHRDRQAPVLLVPERDPADVQGLGRPPWITYDDLGRERATERGFVVPSRRQG